MSAVSRRRLLVSGAGAALLGVTHARAQGGDYPSRRITAVVAFPPGGSADFFGRTVFVRMAAAIGQTIVVDNKAGASGIIGAKFVINAAPDGYTLLVSSVASVTIPPSLTDPPAFDPLKDLTGVAGIGTVPAVLVVNPSLGIKTFAELIAYAKAHPGKLNLASSGNGTIAHLTGELLMRETGIKIVHVPYRGAPPAVLDLLSGRADLMFSDAPFFLEHIRTGKLVALAVGTKQRAPSLPNVPTTTELGYPAIQASNTYSLFAPPRTPPEIVNKLNELVRAVLAQEAVKAAFAQQEAIPAGDTPENFAALMRAEAERWVPIAKAVGAKGD
jgi:tripartite-type tricarboxylate transporter receptor subunit TctC